MQTEQLFRAIGLVPTWIEHYDFTTELDIYKYQDLSETLLRLLNLHTILGNASYMQELVFQPGQFFQLSQNFLPLCTMFLLWFTLQHALQLRPNELIRILNSLLSIKCFWVIKE